MKNTVKRRLKLQNLRWSMLFLIFCCFSITVSAAVSDSFQKEVELTLKQNTISYKSLFDFIEKESDYVFVYKVKEVELNATLSVDFKTQKVPQILATYLPKDKFAYEIVGRQIIVKEGVSKRVNNNNSIEKVVFKGVIIDSTGEPLIGATVAEENTTNGALTDLDGMFMLNVSKGASVTCSYIGFNTLKLVVNEDTDKTITLVESTKLLDEVVVVGYGTQKKVNVIGSISSVDSKQLESRAAPNVSNMLTGQLSGVTITQSSGSPGQDAGTIRVRGVGSFGASPNPLVLIDGLPGSLSDINPVDIETISVLKDASSAAIYGSRAANGVILVKTKEGQKGKVSISYNGYVGFNKATELPNMASSWRYAEMYNLAMGRDVYSEEDIRKYKDGSDPDNFANESYLDDLFGGKGFQTGHELTMNGGSDRTKYMLSVGYLNQDGILKHNYFDRYNARVNLTTDISKNVILTTRLAGMKSKRNEPSTPGAMDSGGVGGIIINALRYPGLWPTKLSDGEFGAGAKLNGTPKSWIDSGSFYKDDYTKFQSNVELAYTPIKGLTLKAIAGYNYTNRQVRHFRSAMRITGDRYLGPSRLDDTMYKTAYKTFQAIADYNTKIGKHDISALLGYTWEEESQRYVGGSRLNFPSDDVPYLGAGAADGQSTDGSGYDWAILSYFGRVGYNYDERYLFETTMRYDGSSRFPKSNKYGLFPSFAVGWRLSEERFIKENNSFDFLDNLKLKASVGVLGNNNIGNYPYQSTYALGANMNYVFGGVYQQGAAVTTYVDPTLKWEKTRTTDFGFESSFWRGLLSFDLTYFYRKTTDILYRPTSSYSSIFGLNLSQVNTGSLENKGWEFEIGHRNSIGDFSYNVNANFSIIKNKVLSLGVGDVVQENGMIGNGSDLFIGHPMGMYYGYKTDGVFLTDAEVGEWADQTSIAPGAQAGDLRYVDVNNDGKVDSSDRVYLGSRIPKYTFGLNLGAEYKGFDFSMLLQGVSGVKGYLNNWAGFAFFQEGNIQKWQMDETWSNNQTNRYPKYPRLEVMSNAGSNNTHMSDYWLLNASYIKVRNIQLGYTIPQRLMQKIGLSSLRVYFSTDNPFSFTNYRKGWDPEINTGGNYYPIMSTYTFGLTLKF